VSYGKFEDLGTDEQIELLRDAVKQLQSRFQSHEHNQNGNVMIDAFNDEVDLDHIEND
jgi:hypothetical protein